MVLLPEERGMTLAELRQIAARQQHQIEAQQQLLVAKEQRLKFLKQQEARHHALSEQQLETNCLFSLRDKIETQELKLRHLRALRGQVDQQKTNNGNLGTELESIRALFCEKEKELDLAVNKVEELTRQLDEIRKNSQKNYFLSSTSDLENLRRELLYRTKLSEQQNNYICQQKEKIAFRQQDIAVLDNKINELNKRLHSKSLLNEHFACQIHAASLSCNSSSLKSGLLVKKQPRTPEVLEPEQTQDDLAAHLHGHHKYDFGEFSLTKNDPKYQTLPYNTKFSLRDRQLEDSLSSSTEEDSWSSRSENPGNDNKIDMSFPKMCNFSPRPFNNSCNGCPGIQKVDLQISDTNTQQITQNTEITSDNNCPRKESVQESAISKTQSSNSESPNQDRPQAFYKASKPAVPPKPALSVKPMLSNRDTGFSSKRKESPEVDTVSMALSVLKNKSSEKEKFDFRYSGAPDSSHDPLLPKSRILTYFSKTLLQPDGSGHDQNDKVDQSEVPKRKSSFGQLPIKPKPLTIRKNPSIEPPKLKVHPVASLTPHRKVVESQPALFPVKSKRNLLTSEMDEKSTDSLLPNHDDLEDTVSTILPKDEKDDIHIRTENKALYNTGDQHPAENEEKGSEISEIASDEADSVTDLCDTALEHHLSNTSLCKIKKGNLKCEGTLRGSRRVSFDPLALLLDAALEGELELVKKTASEVINPSAANDEGITALHNAICAGHFDVVKFLVEYGCDVNAQDSDGWTPLHCSASCNNLAMVKFLVERGACIFATTLSDQETAAEKCEEDEEGFDGCSEYLFSLQENLGIINSGVVYAVYDYDVQNADELSFRNGDTLTVLRKSDDEENEWWWSRLNDEEGYVPRNLLGLYPRVTSPKSEKSS